MAEPERLRPRAQKEISLNWHDLATTSHYQTAVAVKHALHADDTDDAMQGIEELIDALARSDRRALESHLMGCYHTCGFTPSARSCAGRH